MDSIIEFFKFKRNVGRRQWLFTFLVIYLFLWAMISSLAQFNAELSRQPIGIYLVAEQLRDWWGFSYLSEVSFSAYEMPVLLAFVSGMLGGTFAKLTTAAFPDAKKPFQESERFFTRIILGGVAGIIFFIVTAAGSSTVFTDLDAISQVQQVPNPWVVATTSLLAGVFTMKITGSLKDRLPLETPAEAVAAVEAVAAQAAEAAKAAEEAKAEAASAAAAAQQAEQNTAGQ